MRLYSSVVERIDSVHQFVHTLMGKNSARALSLDDLRLFYSHLSDLFEFMSDTPLEDFLTKR